MNTRQNTRRQKRRFFMHTKLNFIRRFVEEASHVARLVAFNIELDVDLSEAEILEEVEARGYGLAADG
jgi:hypothetical protein